MPVNSKKAEFAPVGAQAGSSSRTFHPEATAAGGKVHPKNYTGWNANSHNHSDLGITKTYRGITLIARADKIYNT